MTKLDIIRAVLWFLSVAAAYVAGWWRGRAPLTELRDALIQLRAKLGARKPCIKCGATARP